MAQRRLTTTRTADYAPLGTAGQRSYQLIQREVSKLGPQHAALFAEPSASPEGDVIDWYCEASKPAVPLEKVAPELQAKGEQNLAGLVRDILERADELDRSKASEQRRLATALRNAVEVPSKTCVYLVDDQPIIVCWAHRRNVAQAQSGVLTAIMSRPLVNEPEQEVVSEPIAAERVSAESGDHAVGDGSGDQPPPQPSEPAEQRRRRWGWLWWLLWGASGATAVLVGLLLIPACGIAAFLDLDYCPRAQAAVGQEEAAKGAMLEDRLAALQRELGLAQTSCIPEQREMPIPVEPIQESNVRPPEPDEVEERLAREGIESDVDLRISLTWDTLTDLDLHVICPNGQKISYLRKRACGGVLNVDKNANRGTTREPIENVDFPGQPPHGTYRVIINNYLDRGGRSNYKLSIFKNGDVIEEEGTMVRGSRNRIYTFTYP